MKYIILITFFLSTSVLAKVGKVPSDWIGPDNFHSQKIFSPSQMINPDLDAAYENILKTKQELFESTPDDSHRRWYLQSIKTEVAIEAAGTIGIMGVGGEAALELIWIKKINKTSLIPQLSEVVQDEGESVQITSEMTPENLMNEITPVVDLAIASGHVKKRKRLFKNLYREALNFQKTARELEGSPVMGPWYAYKYQLELYISAEGKISVIEVGNSLRLRMEWYRLKKEQLEKQHLSPLVPEELSDNAKFVASIASDLESINEVEFSNGFRLNAMKVGVGTNVKGNLYFLKAQAKAKGSIFFKRDDKVATSLQLPYLMTKVSSYELEDDGKLIKIPRFNFRNSLKKGAKISQYFASRAKTKTEGKFELSVIETEFEIFSKGGLGIVTVEGNAGVTMFITRNVEI